MGKRLIQSVVRATKILDYIGANDNNVRLIDISRSLELNKSTLHSIISTLEERGYVEQNKDNQRYSLGSKVFTLGRIYEKDMSLTRLARPLLNKLVEEFQETVQLGILAAGKVLYIDTVESKHTLRMTCTTGETSKLHCSATGKVLLAYLDKNKIKDILEQKLEPYTSNTIVDQETLKEELKIVKDQGYAFDREESELGLNCVAVPVKNHSNQVVATIGISAPISRVPEKRLLEIKDRLIELGNQLSEILGYRD
ncbi:IclR family transcriptional regulator [Orenia marismortui]|uniref:IclR family transcriptional regulator n=1 Tax=Orenia marismortui TaxID=46469 RepID=UPI00037A17F7|nr:IclR family transcriptional regulator [Orenia marismortui]